MGDRRSDPRSWTLPPVVGGSGFDHMATDEAIFQGVVARTHLPTLRFYTWDSPTISLGYHQRQIPEHWETLQYAGSPVDRVRRPTGGRAVLHQGDLTYAIIAPGFTANRSAAYQQICEFLIRGWRSIGVELQYGNAGRGYIHNPNCFATATGADLILNNGSKLIGSAQKRSGDVILQHGSICLNPDKDLWCQVFKTESPQIPDEIRQQSHDSIIKALTESAIDVFNIC